MWFEKLDFDRNPFDVDPIKADSKMIGNEKVKEEIIYRVHSGSMVFVEGKSGTGKTALLKHVIDNFKGRGRVIFLNCEKLEKEANIEKILVGKNGIVGKLFKRYPKGMILLMDGVELSSPKNTERIKYFFDQNYLKTVIFTGNSFKSVKLSPSVKDRIGGHVIKLDDLSETDAIELINERLKGKEIIPIEIVKKVYNASKKNSKELLINCERLCILALDKGEKIVAEEHFDGLFLNGKKPTNKKTTPKKENTQKKLKENPKKEKKKVEVEYSSSIKFGGKKSGDWKENEEELEDELKKEIEDEQAAEKYY